METAWPLLLLILTGAALALDCPNATFTVSMKVNVRYAICGAEVVESPPWHGLLGFINRVPPFWIAAPTEKDLGSKKYTVLKPHGCPNSHLLPIVVYEKTSPLMCDHTRTVVCKPNNYVFELPQNATMDNIRALCSFKFPMLEVTKTEVAIVPENPVSSSLKVLVDNDDSTIVAADTAAETILMGNATTAALNWESETETLAIEQDMLTLGSALLGSEMNFKTTDSTDLENDFDDTLPEGYADEEWPGFDILDQVPTSTTLSPVPHAIQIRTTAATEETYLTAVSNSIDDAPSPTTTPVPIFSSSSNTQADTVTTTVNPTHPAIEEIDESSFQCSTLAFVICFLLGSVVVTVLVVFREKIVSLWTERGRAYYI